MARRRCFGLMVCGMMAGALSAQTFTTLFSFDATDGEYPNAGLIQGTDGNFYGTTTFGGAHGPEYGTVFRITPAGVLTTIYSFCAQAGCPDGDEPYGALAQATNGELYGTTAYGGANGWGTVFRITRSGALTTLHSFCANTGCTDGAQPYGGLIQAISGNLYGTTSTGGPHGGGTVFMITPLGTLTTLYGFCAQSNCMDGEGPRAGLVQGADRNFYGTTLYGGVNSMGTVFRVSPSGAFTTLYSFCAQSSCADGATPYSALIQAANGDFYGTTQAGGAGGTVFQISPSGLLTTLYSFCRENGCTDGAFPYGALVQATDGSLYGTTGSGGANQSGGTLFQIAPGGALTTVFDFPAYADPRATLVQGTDGTFYGTTSYGGTFCPPTSGCGTVFSLSVGLGPFVKPQPAAAKVGGVVEILGTDLAGATSVTFNGTPAVYKIASGTLITTTVPSGATSGKIQVVAPSGALSSNVPFRVLP